MLQTEERYCENSLKAYRDIKNSLDSAEEKGRAEGLAAGRAEGLAAGRAEGLAAGRAEGLATGRAEGLAAGRAEGLAAGRAEEKASVAKKLLALGVPIKHIAEATNLTIDEIEKLQH